MPSPMLAKKQQKMSSSQPGSQADGAQQCRKKGCNSPTAGNWGNLKSAGAKSACVNNCLTMKSRCELNEQDRSQQKKDKDKRKNLLQKRRKAIARLKQKGKISEQEAKKANDQNARKNTTHTWKHKHCKNLIVKPDLEGLKNKVEQLQSDIENKIIDIKSALLDGLLDKGVEVLQEKSTHLAARTGVRHGVALLGGPLAAFTEAIAGVITIIDAVYTTVTVPLEIYNSLEQLENKLEQYQKLKAQFGREISEFNEHIRLRDQVKQDGITSLDNKSRKKYEQFKEKLDKQLKELTDTMVEKAASNPCITVKRCQLVSYEDSRSKSKNMSSAGGCCPGQTGHHLLPKAYFNNSNCPGYQENKAPCICVEGTNQHSGSHGKMHRHLDEKSSDFIENNKLSYKDAKKAALYSVKKTFSSPCDPDCLAKQLDDYHLQVCGAITSVYPASTLKSGQRLDGASLPTPGDKHDDINL